MVARIDRDALGIDVPVMTEYVADAPLHFFDERQGALRCGADARQAEWTSERSFALGRADAGKPLCAPCYGNADDPINYCSGCDMVVGRAADAACGCAAERLAAIGKPAVLQCKRADLCGCGLRYARGWQLGSAADARRVCNACISRAAASEELNYRKANNVPHWDARRIDQQAAMPLWQDADDDLATEERGWRASSAELQFYNEL